MTRNSCNRWDCIYIYIYIYPSSLLENLKSFFACESLFAGVVGYTQNLIRDG